jgi:glycosyltransferase involved in cell wall biosynthesis
MPVHNEECWLHQSIPSILQQTFEDFEFIIINDASTDNSLTIISEYMEQDSRIRLINNSENLKLIETLNKGIDLANGKYIARMDADDTSLPDRLNKQLDFLKNNPDIQLVGTGSEVINEEGNRLEITNDSYLPHILVKWCLIFKNVFTHGSILCKSQMLKENQYASWAVNGEDYELWARLKERYKMARIPDILYKRRSHFNSISHKNRMSLYKIGYTISTRQMETYIGGNFNKRLPGYLINCKLKKNRDIGSLLKAILLLNELLSKFREMNNLNVVEENIIMSWTRRYRVKVLRKHLVNAILRI